MTTTKKYYDEQNDYFSSKETFSYSFRIEVLKKLLIEITSQKESILEALNQDLKKPYFEGFVSEYVMVVRELKDTIKNLKTWMKPEKKGLFIPNFPSYERIYKEPYGQVLIISPWNYPFSLAMSPLISAVAAGNCVVLKASELSKATDSLLEKIIKKVFNPLHVCSVRGDATVGEELLKLRWDYIFFTGSVPVGKIIAKEAAKELIPVTLELGGKNPTIIDKNIDLEVAASRIIWGKFINTGQTCIAPDYLIVHEDIYDVFVRELKKQLFKTYGNDIKNNPDYARVINEKHFKRLVDLLEGERIITGGEYDEKEHYISPTLVAKPSLDSKIMNEEIFGPLLPVLTFKTQDDISKIINKNEKPLAMYTFSRDSSFVKTQLESFSFGGGCVNDVIMHYVNKKLPFGGVGHSGMGSYHGKYSFDLFSHHKSISHRFFIFDLEIRKAPYTLLKYNLIQKILRVK